MLKLGRSGPSLDALDAIDAYEVSEAFAPVPLAWAEQFGAGPDKLNPRAARSP